MAQRLFRVSDVFAFKSGLIIVATDCDWDALPAVLQIGDPIEVRRSDGSVFRTTIAGIPIGGGPTLNRPFDFSLPRGTAKDEIEIGAEIWLT
jgi:hypothetical protein